MRIKVVLGAGMLLSMVALGVTLSHKPSIVTKTNLSFTHTQIAATTAATGACQRETLPEGTSAIRLGLTTVLGPEVNVRVLSGSHLLTSGQRGAGWEGASVTVPVRPLARAYSPVSLCFRLRDLNGPVAMLGVRTANAAAVGEEGKQLPGRLHIEYLHPGRRRWWSTIVATARRLGLGRAAAGTWNALLVLTLAATLVALSYWLLARDLR
ncbi:MAG TPA: hypothetical protein VK756_01485 [Solirubrobacteraceae bacterium]|nr:hypothetical protein [Solirubrobacteraceae bacterium]